MSKTSNMQMRLKKKGRIPRAVLIVAAAITVSGAALFVPPASVSATHHECDDYTFRYSTTYKKCVTYIQTMLNNLYRNGVPNPGLAVDGYYGSKTVAAVRAFQDVEKIGKDGITGPNTWHHLCHPQEFTWWTTGQWSAWYNAARAAGCNV